MPIPKPKTNEKQSNYINRCMEAIGGEYEDPKQAVAVCFSEWRKKDSIDIDDIYNNDLYETVIDIERPNFHSARVKNPGVFQKEQFRLKKIPGSNVVMVLGRLKGEMTTTVQSYLFPKEKYTIAQVRAWLKENEVKAIKIVPAREDNSDTKIEQRFDFTDLMEYGKLNGLEESFLKTDEGYLTGKAIVTNIGVFTYRNPDGTLRRELRLPQEVFHPDSLETLKMKPISNNHPDELVIDAENIKKHQVGFTGSEIYTDPYHLSIPITITDKQAIDDVNNGKRALSAGYSLMLENKPGVWMGVPYDAIQRNIKYNHVAIVDKGRAGDAAKIRMDQAENIMYSIGWENDTALENKEKEDKTLNEENLQLKKITLDGVEYKAEADVVKAVMGLQKQVDSLKKEIEGLKTTKTELETEKSKLEADRDTYKDKAEQLEKDSADDTKIEERVQKRIRVLTAAEMASVSVDGKTEKDIMKEVIIKKYPKAILDNRDDVYIEARFDATIEQLEVDVDKSKTEQIFSFTGDDAGRPISADDARKKMMKTVKNLSRGLKEGDK